MPVQSLLGVSAATVDRLITRNEEAKISPINTNVLFIAFTGKISIGNHITLPRERGVPPREHRLRYLHRLSMGGNISQATKTRLVRLDRIGQDSLETGKG